MRSSKRCRHHVSAQDTYFFQNGETFLGKPINDFSFPLTSCSTILPSCLLCQHFNLSVKYTFLTWNYLEENATPEFFLGQGWEETMFWESRTSNIWRNILAPTVTEMFKVIQNPYSPITAVGYSRSMTKTVCTIVLSRQCFNKKIFTKI